MLYLTAMTFIPLLGAIIILMIPKTQEKAIKNFSIVLSLIPLAISIFLWFVYDASGKLYTEGPYEWIPSLAPGDIAWPVRGTRPEVGLIPVVPQK